MKVKEKKTPGKAMEVLEEKNPDLVGGGSLVDPEHEGKTEPEPEAEPLEADEVEENAAEGDEPPGDADEIQSDNEADEEPELVGSFDLDIMDQVVLSPLEEKEYMELSRRLQENKKEIQDYEERLKSAKKSITGRITDLQTESDALIDELNAKAPKNKSVIPTLSVFRSLNKGDLLNIESAWIEMNYRNPISGDKYEENPHFRSVESVHDCFQLNGKPVSAADELWNLYEYKGPEFDAGDTPGDENSALTNKE